MPDTVEMIVDTFPHPTITPMQGIPSFVSIRQIQVELNANASSIHSNLGPFLTVLPTTYVTLSDVSLVIPENPGPLPVIPAQMSASAAADTRTEYTELNRIFNQYIAIDLALKSQIIKSVDDLYMKALKHRITGYVNVTTREMANPLYLSYGKMTPQDLQLLDEDMKKPYDPHLPIKNLFEQIENGKDLVEATGAPYADSKPMNIAYNLISLE